LSADRDSVCANIVLHDIRSRLRSGRKFLAEATTGEAESTVKRTESVRLRRLLEQAVDLFDPDAVIVWNGREVARVPNSGEDFCEKFFDAAIRE